MSGPARLRWGLAGPGGIAERFAAALAACDGGQLTVVASRDLRRARSFADAHGAPIAVGSHLELVGHPEVDVVYVALPNSHHAALTVECLDAGHHVVCEKPMATDATQVRAMTDAAERNGRFLMEGLWSRFLPAYRRISDELALGRIGRPVLVEGSVGFRAPFDSSHRWFDPALGGGALLDLGIYPLQLAELALGPIESVHAAGVVGSTGVDEVTTVLTRHAGGGAGVSISSLRIDLDWNAVIRGERGRIELAAPLHDPPRVRFIDAAGTEVVDGTYDGDGLRFEIDEVHRCISRGATESPTVRWSDSIALAEAMDEVRRQLGVRYPSDRAD
ncbi:Gfo/Idh/MocA family protein [Dermatobacter hominis]|uniref:Gfo/Idh/MocA family protein n=1 Tax=Dermatobacter hominis TaxID=2884263 RepID=UPI001D100D8E|nr:Gfo/Idh/MocA family oxidoreductase [Dermatobacter hominis]UDY34902.1 Gfo/Idh/MocA family oxidoreductase [Dermatobacter hominis]